MALIEIKSPTQRELRWFGLPFAAFFAIIGGLLWWRGAATPAHLIWASATGLLLLYYAIPALRRPIYLGWMYAAFPMGFVVSHILVAAIYYLLFTPVGLFMRVFRRDPLERRFDAEAQTYWTRRRQRPGTSSYFRQF